MLLLQSCDFKEYDFSVYYGKIKNIFELCVRLKQYLIFERGWALTKTNGAYGTYDYIGGELFGNKKENSVSC